MSADKTFRALGDEPMTRLTSLMRRLRDPEQGCPWDCAQDFTTIAPYTIEEAYEVSDAIERGDMDELKEELGDLLLQVVFHGQMADEQGAFDFGDICDVIVKKMIARHPHVFGDAKTGNWEDIKAAERSQKAGKNTSILDGIALALPALMRADKLQKRAARVGFDWAEPEQVLQKIIEEAGEIVEAQKQASPQKIQEEVGDLLFAVANLARKLGVDPEQALRGTNDKFINRFSYIEDNANKELSDMPLDEMEILWRKAKEKGL